MWMIDKVRYSYEQDFFSSWLSSLTYLNDFHTYRPPLLHLNSQSLSSIPPPWKAGRCWSTYRFRQRSLPEECNQAPVNFPAGSTATPIPRLQPSDPVVRFLLRLWNVWNVAGRDKGTRASPHTSVPGSIVQDPPADRLRSLFVCNPEVSMVSLPVDATGTKTPHCEHGLNHVEASKSPLRS